MRDTNEGMIELLDVSNKNSVSSAVIRYKIVDENLKLRFAIAQADYRRLKRILEFRPFENTGVAAYRYFFVLSYHKDTEIQELAHIKIRVEQSDRHKQFEFPISKKLISNILWFHSLKDKAKIKEMIEK